MKVLFTTLLALSTALPNFAQRPPAPIVDSGQGTCFTVRLPAV